MFQGIVDELQFCLMHFTSLCAVSRCNAFSLRELTACVEIYSFKVNGDIQSPSLKDHPLVSCPLMPIQHIYSCDCTKPDEKFVKTKDLLNEYSVRDHKGSS
jgi:hypothetical protein